MKSSLFKKEDYLAGDKIRKFTQDTLKKVEELRKHHSFDVDINKTALIVLDMQNAFTKKSSRSFIPSSLAIIDNINKLIDSFSQKGMPVIFTAQTPPKHGSSMAFWWRSPISMKSEWEKIDKKLGKPKKLIYKKNYDAFLGTSLEKYLKARKIDTVVIAGTDVHICCQATAMSAFARNLKVLYLVDATAGYNKRFHENAIISLATSCVVPVSTEEVIKKINENN